MKRLLTFTFLVFFGLNLSAQRLHLSISGNSDSEIKTIDSVGYKSTHENAKSVIDEINQVSEKLSKIGFLGNRILEQKKANDSTFVSLIELGNKTKFIHIYIGTNSELKSLVFLESKTDTIVIPFTEVEVFLNSTLNKLEKKGFALSKLKLVNIVKKNNFLQANLQLITDKKRNLNDFVINGYEKFPNSFRKNIKRKYKNQVFNQDNLKKIYSDFNSIRFVKQTKYPEILFTKDSTKIYVYLEKAKSNTFDGFIGFSNDENKKLVFNGYVDLVLNNALNVGEKFSLYWKSDGKDQKTFNVGIEIPYVFETPIAIKAQLNLFKQDSTFQNTKTALDLGYLFNYKSKVFLGYQATESNDIKNASTAVLSDFNNSFVTSTYEYLDYNNDDALFPEKANFNLKIGTGKRNSKFQNNQQVFASLMLNYHYYLNKKNCITIKSQNFYLQSDSYITNELFRFGGINSIRGFNENSLQANAFASVITEYQYILAPTIYVHTLLDYGYFQDKTTNNTQKLLGVGFGFGLITKNGIFNLVYANGSTNDQAIKFSSSIVHISLKTNF